MYCDFVGPFLQSTLRPFYLGCGSNRFCLDNSLGCEVISYLHPCIIPRSCLDILLHCLTFERFKRVPSVLTDHILQHLMSSERWFMLLCFPMHQYCYSGVRLTSNSPIKYRQSIKPNQCFLRNGYGTVTKATWETFSEFLNLFNGLLGN